MRSCSSVFYTEAPSQLDFRTRIGSMMMIFNNGKLFFLPLASFLFGNKDSDLCLVCLKGTQVHGPESVLHQKLNLGHQRNLRTSHSKLPTPVVSSMTNLSDVIKKEKQTNTSEYCRGRFKSLEHFNFKILQGC